MLGAVLLAVSNFAAAAGLVGDFVWRDVDGNGIQDDGETGWEGVTVSLLDCNGPVIAATSTDSSGHYSFAGLPAGRYQVEVALPAGATFSPKAAGSDDSRNSDVRPDLGTTWCTRITSAGEQRTTLDAGLVPDGGSGNGGSIGDFVWRDGDGDGIQDAGEDGWPGVTVSLLACSSHPVLDPLLATTTTDSAGTYSFEGLQPGRYRVKVEPPAGTTFSPQGMGADTGRNSDVRGSLNGTTWCATITSAGEQSSTLDAGLVPASPDTRGTGSIGDFVWRDTDGDGIQDPEESGWPDVTVALYECGGGPPAGSLWTDAAGNYRFDGLPPGNYEVRVTLPAGAAFSPQGAGNDSSRNSDVRSDLGRTWCTTITSAGEQRTTLDAGLVPEDGEPGGDGGSVGDFVWRDSNGNGRQDDGEPGWPDVLVGLHDCDGSSVIATQLTDADGIYRFEGLPSGRYATEVVVPEAATLSTDLVGAEPDRNTDVDLATRMTWCASITDVGEDRSSLDVGLVPDSNPGGPEPGTSSLGDFVWHDVDGDGVQEAGEPGLAGVEIKLRACRGGTYLQTTYSDGSGRYRFDNLAVGSYLVQFVIPAGMRPSPEDQATEGQDSDVNLLGQTGCNRPRDGEHRGGVDAGFH
ncbi:MAG TPA: SdrD B-like domain-containing protein [Woeseiaceae bacterium]|nr:SdrD B-like domain-containing protein [Woeseiaceae bacterium]